MDIKDKNAYVSRSLALTTADDKDPSKGFWMAYIDNKSKKCPEVKCMMFEKEIMEQIHKEHNEKYQKVK